MELNTGIYVHYITTGLSNYWRIC